MHPLELRTFTAHLDERQLDTLCRTLLHALRHAPEQYFLELGSGGWVSLDHVALAMRYARAGWSDLVADDLRTLVDSTLNDRIEIAGDLIRARYGHSATCVDAAAASEPPPVLFHGTHAAALVSVRDHGLQPMGRQRVHLTSDMNYACEVAEAKGGRPVLLEIAAASACEAGVEFCPASAHVWLTERVPARFIQVGPVRSQINRPSSLDAWLS